MKDNCSVIKDLLPLYMEELTREESNKMIIGHIKECEECGKELEILKKAIAYKKEEIETTSKDKLSKGLIKKIRKRMVFLVTATLIIGAFIGLFGQSLVGIYGSKYAAKNYLRLLTEENYEETFQYVRYYNQESDRPATLSHKKAQETWVERMEDIREEGIYIKDYDNLTVYLDDGYPTGRVEMTIMEYGEERKVLGHFHFAGSGTKWKVQEVYMSLIGAYQEDRNVKRLKKALSGYVGEVIEEDSL